MRRLIDRFKDAVKVVRGQGVVYDETIITPTNHTTIVKKNPYSVAASSFADTPQRTLVDFESYYVEGYNENSLIYAAVNYKSEQITQAKLTAYQYVDDKDNFDKLGRKHPLQMLLDRPNQYMSGDEFHSLQNMFFNLTGNAFTYLERKNNEIIKLWPLNPAWVWIVPDKKGEIVGYEYKPYYLAGEIFPIEPQNMAHWKKPNPLDPLNGLGFGQSPINAMAMSGDVDNMITRFLNVFFKHGAMPAGILKFKDLAMDENDIAAVRERWQETYGGYQNFGKVGVLDGQGDYQRIGLTFEEMDFEKLDQRNEARILSAFGVPVSLLPTVSALQGSTYNNKTQDRKMFWEDVMTYELEVVEQELSRFFNTDDIFIKWDLSEVKALKNDVNLQIDSAVKLVGIGVPPQTSFKTVGLNIEDYEGIQDRLLSTSITSLDMIERQFEQQKQASEANAARLQAFNNQQDGETPKPDEEPNTNSEAKNTSFLELDVLESSFDLEQKKRIYSEFDQIAVNHEQVYRNKTEECFNTDRKAILALIGESKKLALELKASVNWNKTLVDVLSYYKLNSPPIWQAEFVPLVRGVYNDVGKFWANELGVAFNIRNLEGELALDAYTLIFANFVSETSSNEVKAVIQQGMSEGWSIETMINHLNDVFEQWIEGNKTLEDLAWMAERKPLWRLELIARTETTRAANQGAITLYDKWGVKSKEWLATMDDRTRDTHLNVNGQIVKIDTPFTLSNGIEIMQPGDSSAPLSETAACRCTVLPIIPKGGLN